MQMKAQKTNFVEVRVCHDELNHVDSLLTSYLNLFDTNSLRTFLITSIAMSDYLEIWRQCRCQNFDIQHKIVKSSWQKIHLWKYILNSSSLSSTQLKFFLSLIDEWIEICREYVSWIVIMYDLLRAHLDRFANVRNESSVKILEEFSFENWNRFYEICRAYWRMSSRSKSLDRFAEINVQKQNKLVIQSFFLIDSRLVDFATNEDTTMIAVSIVDYVESSNEIEENDRFDASLQSVDQLRLDDRFHHDFAQFFRHIITDLQSIDERNFRSKLDLVSRERLLIVIAKQVVELDSLNKTHDAFNPSRSILHTFTWAASQIHTFSSVVISQKIDTTSTKNCEQSDSSSSKSIWMFVVSLDYVNACRLMSLNSTQSEYRLSSRDFAESVADDVFVTSHCWQIVVVIWLIRMKKSSLDDDLLVDDMSLSKTLIALLLIIISTDVKQRRMFIVAQQNSVDA